MHVVVVATMIPLPGKADEVRESLKRYVPKMHDEAGCQLYALHESVDGAFVIVERWADHDVLKSHIGGLAVEQMIAEIAQNLANSPDVRVMHAIPLGDRAKGQIVV